MSREAVYRMALAAIRELSTEDAVQRLVEEALGPEVPSPPPSTGVRRRPVRGLTADERREYERERKRLQRGSMSNGVGHNVQRVQRPGDTTLDTAGDRPGPLSSSPPLSSASFLSVSEEREGARDFDAFNVQHDVQRDVPQSLDMSPGTVSGTRNATADGSLGMLVASWASGIRSVTGEDFPAPNGRAGGLLAETLRKLTDGKPDACEAARVEAIRYARANAGRTLSPFNFRDWVGSGRPNGKPNGAHEAPVDSPTRRKMPALPPKE